MSTWTDERMITGRDEARNRYRIMRLPVALPAIEENMFWFVHQNGCCGLRHFTMQEAIDSANNSAKAFGRTIKWNEPVPF
jgi:hypothetical protein